MMPYCLTLLDHPTSSLDIDTRSNLDILDAPCDTRYLLSRNGQCKDYAILDGRSCTKMFMDA